MQAIKYEETCKVIIGNFQCTISLGADHLRLLLVNEANFCRFTADIDHDFLKSHKHFQFFFTSIAQLYHYLTACFSQIRITQSGNLQFSLQMNVGPRIKKYECQIETNRLIIPQSHAYLLKVNKMKNEIDILKQQFIKLQKKYKEQEEKQKIMSLKMMEYEKIIHGKDEIINTIFHELNQIREWREQFQNKQQEQLSGKHRFIADEANNHLKKFVQIGNKFIKTIGGTWDVLINKLPIDKKEATRYHIRQIRAGNNGSFMYGIASDLIKGLSRAQDSKQFIGYYENTGNVYQQGQSKKGGPKIKDGEVVTITTDPRKWKVYWHINGKKEAEANIGAELRTKNLYLALVIFNDQSQIQFFN